MFNGAVSLDNVTESLFLKNLVMEMAFEQMDRNRGAEVKKWAQGVFKKLRGK